MCETHFRRIHDDHHRPRYPDSALPCPLSTPATLAPAATLLSRRKGWPVRPPPTGRLGCGRTHLPAFPAVGQPLPTRDGAGYRQHAGKRSNRRKKIGSGGNLTKTPVLLPVYSILQILSPIQFEKTPILQALLSENYQFPEPIFRNQLLLVEQRSDTKKE